MTSLADAAAHLRSVLDGALKSAEQLLGFRPARKSINQVVREYQDKLENLVVDAANGNIGVAAFRTKHNGLIEDHARKVYVEGAREGGLDEDELDSDDDDVIQEWRLSQFGYVLDFAKDAVAVSKLEGDERKAARDGMLSRVDLWVGRLRDLGSRGYARAKEGELAYWELGETEKHCKDCLRFSGYKPKRLKYWLDNEILPRSAELECSGLHCDCKLKSVKTDKVLYPR